MDSCAPVQVFFCNKFEENFWKVSFWLGMLPPTLHCICSVVEIQVCSKIDEDFDIVTVTLLMQVKYILLN